MRVAIDTRAARDRYGTGRYVRCLIEALSRHPDRLGGIVETREPRRCELYHSPWLQGALLHPPVPMVVTLHDLIALKRRGEYLRTGLRFKLRYLAAQRASRVIVPTGAVADDAIDRLGIAPERIMVIPEAPAPVFWQRPAGEVAAVRRRYRLPERYLLWVGTLLTPDPRKRVAALARARRTLPLVLVGPASEWARELPGVQVTGAVEDDELAAIYTGAHALVFPSEDEGFGRPPLEALACGAPVAACDLPALREVLDGLVALERVEDLDGLVATAESLSRPASAPPDWSWEDVAGATWEVYRQALADPIGSRRARRIPPLGGATKRPFPG